MELRVSAEYAGKATVKTFAKRSAKVIGGCLTWLMTAHHGSCSNKTKKMIVPAGPGPRGARQQPNAEARFELAHGVAQRRLRNAERRGRFRETALPVLRPRRPEGQSRLPRCIYGIRS